MNNGQHNIDLFSRRSFAAVWIQALLALLLVGLSGCGRHAEIKPTSDRITQGWDRFRMGEYDAAIGAFEAAIGELPAAEPGHIMALYGLATTWNLRMPVGDQDHDRARELYRQIMETASQSDLAPWAALALARMDHLVLVGKDPDMTVVRPAYEAVIARYPHHPAAEEALLYLQSTYVSGMTSEAAAHVVPVLEAFVRERPDSGYTSAAYGLLQDCYQLLNKPEEQLRCLIKGLETREIDPSNPRFEKSWIYWRIASVAEFEAGDFETARKYHRLLLEEYPMDIRGFGAETALKRMNEVETRLRAGEEDHD